MLGWGFSTKAAAGAVAVVAVQEGVDEGVEVVEAGGQIIDGVELVSTRAVAALDSTVDLRTLGRQA